MFILGLQGSPRKKGNSRFLLNTFMQEAEKQGAQTTIIDVPRKNITPCMEYSVCEKKGTCPIDDDMEHEIYPLLRKADVIVAASPIFFYNVPSQLKKVIDRSQTFWARKYMLKINDPGAKYRRGYFFAVGATKGKQLFDGVKLTFKYFFDAVSAEMVGGLTYKRIEGPQDMQSHPTVREDVVKAVQEVLAPFIGRKKVVFACRENACRSQIAAAFAQILGGDKLDVYSAGSTPAEQVNPMMQSVMQEIGIDMGFRIPVALNQVVAEVTPDMIVTMGCGEECPFIPGVKKIDWELADPAGKPIEFMRSTRDEIKKRVEKLIAEI